MFSGIVEAQVTCENIVTDTPELLRVNLARPANFSDIQLGDSICVNGVCLTIENFDEDTLCFAIAYETLKITGWNAGIFMKNKWNLERSLSFGDRVHGHLVAGHVEAMTEVLSSSFVGESQVLMTRLPASLRNYVWHKGSLTINGVSLTINSCDEDKLEFCIIPETQKRTNLGSLKAGDLVTMEPDYIARVALKYFAEKGAEYAKSNA